MKLDISCILQEHLPLIRLASYQCVPQAYDRIPYLLCHSMRIRRLICSVMRVSSARYTGSFIIHCDILRHAKCSRHLYCTDYHPRMHVFRCRALSDEFGYHLFSNAAPVRYTDDTTCFSNTFWNKQPETFIPRSSLFPLFSTG